MNDESIFAAAPSKATGAERMEKIDPLDWLDAQLLRGKLPQASQQKSKLAASERPLSAERGLAKCSKHVSHQSRCEQVERGSSSDAGESADSDCEVKLHAAPVRRSGWSPVRQGFVKKLVP